MSKVISKDGTAIAFNKSGQGEPVILVDGALCSRSFGPMPKLARLLTPNFTVITYDRRGRGESGDTSPYAVEREVEDLQALIAETGGSASLFGASSGAVLALAAAASGLNVKKLALYEPPLVAGGAGHHPPSDSEAQLKQFVAEGRRSDAVKFFIVDIVGMPAISIYIMRFLPIWSKLKAVAHTLPYDASILGDFSVQRRFTASVTAPTIVIGGEKSPVELRGAVSAVAEAVPGAKQRMLKGQTHNVSMKLLAPVLVEFFGVSDQDFRKAVDFASSQSTRQ
jgi:pimeloyl-ACP methyl ester carboxylesterase